LNKRKARKRETAKETSITFYILYINTFAFFAGKIFLSLLGTVSSPMFSKPSTHVSSLSKPMLETLWKDPERYKQTYFGRWPNIYYTDDYAVRDPDWYFWLPGRADEVLKVAGHRIGTVELESALVSHPAVSEDAVMGKEDADKGEVPVAFVT
jgi:acyl-CoA synthetase (AMP-forming)/AMP-acid ligase II